jgi:hypothetical protein
MSEGPCPALETSGRRCSRHVAFHEKASSVKGPADVAAARCLSDPSRCFHSHSR